MAIAFESGETQDENNSYTVAAAGDNEDSLIIWPFFAANGSSFSLTAATFNGVDATSIAQYGEGDIGNVNFAIGMPYWDEDEWPSTGNGNTSFSPSEDFPPEGYAMTLSGVDQTTAIVQAMDFEAIENQTPSLLVGDYDDGDLGIYMGSFDGSITNPGVGDWTQRRFWAFAGVQNGAIWTREYTESGSESVRGQSSSNQDGAHALLILKAAGGGGGGINVLRRRRM